MDKIISDLGLVGIGTIIGVLVQVYFENRRETKRLLFEARYKAYGSLVGRLFNLFLEPDISSLGEALRIAKLNQLLSEATLVGSISTIEMIGDLKIKVNQMHKILELRPADEKNSEAIHKELTKLVGRVHEQFRKDLFLDSKIYDDFRKNET